jgi:hypothetical protein
MVLPEAASGGVVPAAYVVDTGADQAWPGIAGNRPGISPLTRWRISVTQNADCGKYPYARLNTLINTSFDRVAFRQFFLQCA